MKRRKMAPWYQEAAPRGQKMPPATGRMPPPPGRGGGHTTRGLAIYQ